MIINQSVGFAFIHIPKSAGTSVTEFLSPLNGPLDLEIGGTAFGESIQPAYWRRHRLRKHSTLAEAQHVIEMARPEYPMFTFTFVRNPFERLASIFSFLRKWEDCDPELLQMMRGFTDFEEFVASGIFTSIPGPDSMFKPQVSWIKLDGRTAAHVHLFQIEEVDSALSVIREKLLSRGGPADNLPNSFPHSNRSQSDVRGDLELPRSLVKMILDFYAEDFHAFGYHHR